MTLRTLLVPLVLLVLSMLPAFAQPELDSTYAPENIGPMINSRYNEVLPVISPDGRTIYFDRTNHPKNYGRDDIWYSTLGPDGKWTQAINIGPPLNNTDNNFVCSVSPDGNTLLLGNIYHSNGTNSPGASVVHRTENGWGNPVKLEIKNFYNKHIIGNLSLGNDAKTLILSLQRDDSYGELDLYVSFLQEGGEWSEPLNLGSDVNSKANDGTPFLASDGMTLYFSSEGHGGFGSSDIFVARRLDNSWTQWTRPENLGRPINTSGWDGFFTIPASGDYAYLASGEKSYGMQDIFRVRLPKIHQPKSVVLVSGFVLDSKTRQPVTAQIVYETLANGTRVGTARSNPKTGSYTITLPMGERYGFRAEAPGFVPINDNIDLVKLLGYQEITRDLYLVPIEVGQTIRLNNIFFEFGSSDLTSDSFAELDRVIKLLNDNPTMAIEIGGHTDSVGTDQRNKRLSQRRANAVMKYLVGKDINEARVTVVGYGMSVPVESNNTEEGRRNNRRVEFRITNK